MTKEQALAFIERVPWRWVREDRGPIDPHQYVISDWPEVEVGLYWEFVRLVRREGYQGTYRAPYRPEVELRNHYLELDGWVYWTIPPTQICRTRIEDRQHEPVPANQRLREDRTYLAEEELNAGLGGGAE